MHPERIVYGVWLLEGGHPWRPDEALRFDTLEAAMAHARRLEAEGKRVEVGRRSENGRPGIWMKVHATPP